MAEPSRAELAAALEEAQRERSKLQSELYTAQQARDRSAGYVEEIVSAALPDAESQALAGCVAALEALERAAKGRAENRSLSRNQVYSSPAVRRILVALADRYGVAPVVCPPGFVVRLEPEPEPEPTDGYGWSPGYERPRFEVRPVQ